MVRATVPTPSVIEPEKLPLWLFALPTVRVLVVLAALLRNVPVVPAIAPTVGLKPLRSIVALLCQ